MDSLQIALGAGLLFSVALNSFVIVLLVRMKRTQEQKSSLHHYTIHLDGSKYFADVNETEVKRLVQDKLTEVTTKAAEHYQEALNKMIPKLTGDIEHMNSDTLRKEFDKYHASLSALNDEALQAHTKMLADVKERRTQLLAAVDKKVITNYQERLASFDDRFADVVSGYIADSLGPQADLGAQLPAIIAQLEKQKEQIKQDILS